VKINVITNTYVSAAPYQCIIRTIPTARKHKKKERCQSISGK